MIFLLCSFVIVRKSKVISQVSGTLFISFPPFIFDKLNVVYGTSYNESFSFFSSLAKAFNSFIKSNALYSAFSPSSGVDECALLPLKVILNSIHPLFAIAGTRSVGSGNIKVSGKSILLLMSC